MIIDPSSFITYGGESFIVITIPPESLITISDFQQSNLLSSVIDVQLINGEISSPVRICFEVNQTDTKDTCLGYLDESKDPPIWKCEDKCVKKEKSTEKNDTTVFCGETSHFTSFALLFEGIAKGGCGGEDYILGSYKNDLILAASVAGFVILIAILVFILFSYTPLKKYALGKEANSLSVLRNQSSELPVNGTDIVI